MTHVLVGNHAPAFELPDQTGTTHKLSDYNGRWVVLYFYPKDMTPGCTVEACSFRDNEARLKSAGVTVLGVSADSVKRHAKFATNEQLNFPLLADEFKVVCKLYSTFGKKKFMGREYEGIMRHTFLINPAGRVVKVYENVKPATHVQEILRDMDELLVATKHSP